MSKRVCGHAAEEGGTMSSLKQVFGYVAGVAAAIFLTWGASAGAQTVKIAAILPVTGANAAIGIGMMNSIELAVDQANKSGNLGGLRVELVKLDDAATPSVGVSAALKAASDPSVIAAIAHWSSGVALATNDIFHRHGLVNLVPAAVHHKITLEKGYAEIFRITPHDLKQMRFAAEVTVKVRGHKRIFVLDDNTTYGKSLATNFVRYASEMVGKEVIVGTDSISVGEKDFTAVLTRVKALAPDLLFFGGVVTEAGLIRSQMVKLGVQAGFQSGSGVYSETFLKVAGPAAEGVVLTALEPPIDQLPGGSDFIQAYREAGYGKPFESYGIFAYASAQVVLEAIRRAGPDRRAIIEAMKRGTFDTAIGRVSFDQNGDNNLNILYAYEVKGGKFVPFYWAK